MNTTVVAQSAIGALAALIGGLGGASIATRHQRSNERAGSVSGPQKYSAWSGHSWANCIPTPS
jgi:hypothetical protein